MTVYLTGLYEKITLHIREDGKEKIIKISAADYVNNVVSSVFTPVYQDTVTSVFIYLVRLYLSYQLSLSYNNIIIQDESSTLKYTCNKEIYLNIKLLTDELSDKFFIADGEPYDFCKFTDDDLEEFRQFVVNSASSGLSAEIIFSNYFSDIRRMRLYCKDSGYKEYPLKYGYSGSEVRFIQTCLDDIASVIPSVPKTRYSVDWYGIDTVTAVKCFQKSIDCCETGETSRIFRDKLSYFSMKSRDFFEQITFLKNLYEKEAEDITGDDIKSAVKSAVAFNPEIDDGKSGIMESFCRYYQCEPENRYSIIEKLRKIWTVVSDLIPGYILHGCAQPFSGRVLCYGDSSSEVSKIQSYLKVVSVFVPEIGNVRINGKFDDEMLAAVRNFQEKYGIVSDGRVGMFTWNGIMHLYNYFGNTLAINDKKCYNKT